MGDAGGQGRWRVGPLSGNSALGILCHQLRNWLRKGQTNLMETGKGSCNF